ncbi:MAG TPA: hypothetical protein VMT38_04045 [Terracidiphilus sp.]|nr:hypothetical protein [Terracidiphilus sp.]
MICSINSAAQRRFVRSSWIGAGLVVVLTALAAVAVRVAHLHGPLVYPVAVLPALPIIWVLIETGRYLAEEKDEFMRNLLVQCLLGGIGGTLAVTTVWGNLEHFAGILRLDPILIYAIFWFCAALTYPVVYRRYR